MRWYITSRYRRYITNRYKRYIYPAIIKEIIFVAKTLLQFERYLRNLLEDHPKTYFEGTRLLCPPLMFTVMLFIEHSLGDLLHGKLTLKHVVDWVVLRKQDINRAELESRSKEFRFDRFLQLMDALADTVEGKVEIESLELIIAG